MDQDEKIDAIFLQLKMMTDTLSEIVYALQQMSRAQQGILALQEMLVRDKMKEAEDEEWIKVMREGYGKGKDEVA